MYPDNLKLALLIPCYNEELTIGKVIDDFRKELPQADIHVFDNNSTDRSAEIAKEKSAVVVKEKRQGKGFVVDSMFKKIEADIYIMVDGDDTYPADAVHALIRPVLEEEADMTVGTRLKKYGDKAFKPLNLMANHLFKNLVNWIFKSDLSDILSGYRVFNREFVKNIPLSSQGFEVETQLVIQSLYYSYKIKEVEIELRQRPAGSESKLNRLGDAFRIILTIFNVAKAYRPLFFFGLLSLIFSFAGIIIGAIPVVEFLQTGFISHLPSAVLATGMILTAMIFLSIGLILDSLNYRIKEIIHILSKK